MSKRFESLLQALSNEYDDLKAERDQLVKDYMGAESRADMLEAELECVKEKLDAVGMD